jgi:signal transduction histidine kinase
VVSPGPCHVSRPRTAWPAGLPVLTGPALRGDSVRMVRALVAMTGAALLVLGLEVAGTARATLAVTLAVAYAVAAVIGLRHVLDRGRAARAVYIGLEMVLGFAVFEAAGAGVGATLLLLVLVIQAVLLLPLRWAVAVAALVPFVHVGMPWPEALRQGASTGVAAGFAVVLAALHLREQEARAELDVANARLRSYAAKVQTLAATQERNRVARDIHDGLGHHLSVVQMQVQAARAVLPTDPARADELLGKAGHQAREALVEVRRSVEALRAEPNRQSLGQTLAALADETRVAGLDASLTVVGTARPLPPETEEALYRVTQEALTNTRRHAAARSAAVVLEYSADDTVRLRVEDDGAGFVDPRRNGFGLLGIRERIEGLGGCVDVTSPPGSGVVMSVVLPG